MPGKPAPSENTANAAPPHAGDEDAMLVHKAQAGDMEAFETLIKKYESKVYTIASHMLSHGEDAKDAAQDVFLKVYRSLGAFRGDSRFSTWLYRVTNNVCLDYLRKKNRRDLSLEYETEGDEGESRTLDIPADLNIESAVESGEFRSLVRKAIDMLPDQHKSMIVMRDVQSMSYSDISELLGLPEGTVKSRINRARASLRKIFLETRELKEYIGV